MKKTTTKKLLPPAIGWILIASFIFIALVNVIYPDLGLSMGGIGANMMFAILLGIATVGWKNTIIFNLVSFVTTAVIENLTNATGFPFGFYEPFTPGPKIIAVPVVVCLGYFNFAFISWILADLILPEDKKMPPTFKWVMGKQGIKKLD